MIEKKISLEGVPHPSHADAINRVTRDHPDASGIVVDWDAKEARFVVPTSPAPEAPPVVTESEIDAEIARLMAEAAAEDGNAT